MPYGLNMADREETLALILSRSALLFLPTSHSLLPFHSPPSAPAYLALKFITHPKYPLWLDRRYYSVSSSFWDSGQLRRHYWNIGCCGRMREWQTMLLIAYAWKWFMSFYLHFIAPPSIQLQRNGEGQSYKVPGMRTIIGIFANTNDHQSPWLLIYYNISLIIRFQVLEI